MALASLVRDFLAYMAYIIDRKLILSDVPPQNNKIYQFIQLGVSSSFLAIIVVLRWLIQLMSRRYGNHRLTFLTASSIL